MFPIVKRKRLAPGVVSLTLLAPDIAADCEPGCLPGGRPERDSPR